MDRLLLILILALVLFLVYRELRNVAQLRRTWDEYIDAEDAARTKAEMDQLLAVLFTDEVAPEEIEEFYETFSPDELYGILESFNASVLENKRCEPVADFQNLDAKQKTCLRLYLVNLWDWVDFADSIYAAQSLIFAGKSTNELRFFGCSPCCERDLFYSFDSLQNGEFEDLDEIIAAQSEEERQ